MDWISQYQAIISCFMETISLHAPSDRDVIFVGSAMKYSLALLYHLFLDRWTRKSEILFSMVQDGDAVLHIEDIRVVCNYPDVFLHGMQFLKSSWFFEHNLSIRVPIGWLQRNKWS
jgi:hypothetical protein